MPAFFCPYSGYNDGISASAMSPRQFCDNIRGSSLQRAPERHDAVHKFALLVFFRVLHRSHAILFFQCSSSARLAHSKRDPAATARDFDSSVDSSSDYPAQGFSCRLCIFVLSRTLNGSSSEACSPRAATRCEACVFVIIFLVACSYVTFLVQLFRVMLPSCLFVCV